MKLGFSLRSNAVLILGAVLLGAILLAVLVINRKVPDRAETEIRPVAVRTIELRRLPIRLEARGHGIARPAESWLAIANVPGRIVERHPDLESGAFLPAGTLLLAIDPSNYELAIARVEAERSRLEAEIRQLETEAQNTRRLHEVESQRLALSERDLERMQRLADSGAIPQIQLDDQRRSTLGQQQAVAALENALALIPSRRQVLAAQIKNAESALAQAQRDLADTRFVAPYDLRLRSVGVELHQYAGAGERLFEADSLAAAEVEARVPFSQLRRLLAAVDIDPTDSELTDPSQRLELSAIEARLELVGASGVAWSGRVIRVASGLDPTTRAMRVVVRVDAPYRDAHPPDHPPLQRDVYTRVKLSAPSPEPQLVVPATAVHDGELYTVDAQDRLARKPVQVLFEQHDLAVLGPGIAEGERIVIDDLPMAIQGMALAARRDEDFERRIEAMARGEQP